MENISKDLNDKAPRGDAQGQTPKKRAVRRHVAETGREAGAADVGASAVADPGVSTRPVAAKKCVPGDVLVARPEKTSHATSTYLSHGRAEAKKHARGQSGLAAGTDSPRRRGENPATEG